MFKFQKFISIILIFSFLLCGVFLLPEKDVGTSDYIYYSGVNRRNAIINGNFDFWQRATSQTSVGYGSDDRFSNYHIGSTKTHSRQAFTLGQTDVPGNPKYYSRTVVTTGSGAGHLVTKKHSIEGVHTFSGETVTLSFWAKADASKNIATEFTQKFGTGGSPSSTVNAIGVTTHNLTTSWQKLTVTTSIPSVSGKTLGTNNDDSLTIKFYFEAGSDWNSRTNSLGNQSGTFDLAQIQLELGSVATPFERRTLGEELELCRRYYQKTYAVDTVPGTATAVGNVMVQATHLNNASHTVALTWEFKTTMRESFPTVTFYSPATGTVDRVRMYATDQTITSGTNSPDRVTVYASHGTSSIYRSMSFHATADAEL